MSIVYLFGYKFNMPFVCALTEPVTTEVTKSEEAVGTALAEGIGRRDVVENEKIGDNVLGFCKEIRRIASRNIGRIKPSGVYRPVLHVAGYVVYGQGRWILPLKEPRKA